MYGKWTNCLHAHIVRNFPFRWIEWTIYNGTEACVFIPFVIKLPLALVYLQGPKMCWPTEPFLNRATRKPKFHCIYLPMVHIITYCVLWPTSNWPEGLGGAIFTVSTFSFVTSWTKGTDDDGFAALFRRSSLGFPTRGKRMHQSPCLSGNFKV